MIKSWNMNGDSISAAAVPFVQVRCRACVLLSLFQRVFNSQNALHSVSLHFPCLRRAVPSLPWPGDYANRSCGRHAIWPKLGRAGCECFAGKRLCPHRAAGRLQAHPLFTRRPPRTLLFAPPTPLLSPMETPTYTTSRQRLSLAPPLPRCVHRWPQTLFTEANSTRGPFTLPPASASRIRGLRTGSTPRTPGCTTWAPSGSASCRPCCAADTGGGL